MKTTSAQRDRGGSDVIFGRTDEKGAAAGAEA